MSVWSREMSAEKQVGYRVEWLRHYLIWEVIVGFYKTARETCSLTCTCRLKRCILRSLLSFNCTFYSYGVHIAPVKCSTVPLKNSVFASSVEIFVRLA